MDKKFPFAVIAGALVAAAVVPTAGFAATQDKIEPGLYFTNTESGKGEFYSFKAWKHLTAAAQSNLVLKYKQENVKIYIGVIDKVATLSKVSEEKNFDKAATDYTGTEIVGTFVDATTNEDIVIGEVVTPEITAAKIAIGNTIVDFTSLDGATSNLDLSALKPTDTATLATLTVSADSELTLEYKSVEKKIELKKGVNSLSAQDLIPGLNENTPLTVAFLQSISNGENPLNITTTLTDASDKSNTVAGTLTIKIPAN